MPQNDKQVKFYFGTQQEYNNLEFKDTCAIYFITDTKKIYVGEKMYVAPINIQDLDNLNLDDKYLSAFEANINRNTVPIITQNGQLISSGKTIGTSVPENAYFITEENMQTIQNVLQNSTDLQVVGQAPPYYNNNGLMLYTDKEKLDRLPNSLSVATTETNGLMSAEDKRILYSLGAPASYTLNENIYSYSPGLMTGEDKKLLDDLSDNVDDLLEFMSEIDDLIGLVEPSTNGEGGADGLMSAEDKEKLDSLSNIEYTIATSNANGLMSSIDKTKLDGIATGAQVNQNAFSNIIIGATTIAADSKTDTLTLIAGNNVTLTPDNSNGTVTITAIDTINSGTVTNISTGIGLDGGPITSTGTVKVKLKSETTLSEQAVINETANKTYAVRTDSDGYLAVNIPWTDTTYNTATASTNGVGGSNGLMSATDKEKLNTLPNIVSLTQAQYELLNPPDASTLYIIIEGGENE